MPPQNAYIVNACTLSQFSNFALLVQSESETVYFCIQAVCRCIVKLLCERCVEDASCGRHQTEFADGDGGSTSTAAGMTSVICAGCRRPIRDQYMLHINPGLDWHASCLRCAECCQTLDETCTCFVRDGRAYCKSDYGRSVSCFAAVI